MSILVKQLNDVLNDWTKLYDVFSVLHPAFHADQDGNLCFCERPLYPIRQLTLRYAEIEAESIMYHFEADAYIQVYWDWQEDDLPRLHSVCFGYACPAKTLETEEAEHEEP